MAHVDFPQSICRAGIARRDVTPPVGMYHRMWGAARHDRSTGIHKPLFSTALALAPAEGERGAAASKSSRERAQVLVSLDHCLMWNDEMDALRAGVCRATGLERNALHVTFSHTHAAGLLDPARVDVPGGELIGPYLQRMLAQTIEAVNEALDALAEAAIVYGLGRSSLAAHRDFWDEAGGLFVCGYHPEGPSDDTLLVARVSDGSRRTLATIVNYACHPTTLAWDNTLVSPDYVGALRETVEAATAAPCLFLQGASGDLGPRQGYVGDTRVADRNGRELGYAALAALEALPEPGLRYQYAGPVVSGATIGTWDYRPLPAEALDDKRRWRSESFCVELAYRPDLPTRDKTAALKADWQAREQAAIAQRDDAAARDARAQVERMDRQLSRLRGLPGGTSVPLAVTLWRLGDAVWVLLAAEHYSFLQRALRGRFADRPLVIVTMTDGWSPGYLPTAETYGRGIYQESIAIVAAGSLEALADKIGRRIADWGLGA